MKYRNIILSIFLLLSIAINIYCIKEKKNISINTEANFEFVDYLENCLIDINSHLTKVKILSEEEINYLVQNELFELTSASAKLYMFLKIYYNNFNENISNLYSTSASFNKMLTLSDDSRNFICQNSSIFLEIFGELIKYSKYIDSKEFKNAIDKFNLIIQNYYFQYSNSTTQI